MVEPVLGEAFIRMIVRRGGGDDDTSDSNDIDDEGNVETKGKDGMNFAPAPNKSPPILPPLRLCLKSIDDDRIPESGNRS